MRKWSICLLLTAAFSLAAQEKPNVLFIPVDDLRPHFPAYGHSEVVAPNLEKLAAEGAVFLRAYCQQAVCAPSRASLLTGLRPDSTKIYDLEHPVRAMLPNVLTLPQHFKNNGYTTLKIGKVYHHADDDKESWSRLPKTANNANYANPEVKADIAERTKKAKADGLEGLKLSAVTKGPSIENAEVPDNAYADGAMADAVVATLRELKQEGKPFFFAAGFLKPHLPFCAPKKYWDLYDRAKFQLATWREKPKNGPDIAMHSSGELRTYLDIPKKGPVSDDKARELIHGYCAAVSYMDAQLGRILAALDEYGLRENTIVILWGDHGWHLGDHGLWNKHSNFENAVHAPLIVRGPGIQSSIISELTEFVDIYPSLCDLTGIPVPTHLEGSSFLPLLKKVNKPWKKAAFSQYPRGKAMGHSLTDGRYRYTEWQGKDGTLVARELYDHQNDPGETVNLAADPSHSAAIEKLAALMKSGWQGAKP